MANHGIRQARTFFTLTQTLLDYEPQIDVVAPWALTQRLLSSSSEVALHFLARYPDFVHRLGAEQMTAVHTLALSLIPEVAQADAFLQRVGGTLSLLPVGRRQPALAWCRRIADVRPGAVLPFLDQLPELIRQLPEDRLQTWVEQGLDIAQRHAEAGQAYFALESATARECLRSLQRRVVFTDVQRVLQLYTEGLSGRHIGLSTTADISAGLSLRERELPTSDGTTIFVPPQVDDFSEARDNFAVYKVAILHQLGWYEYGSLTFSLTEGVQRIPQLQQLLEPQGALSSSTAQTALGRFFAVFPQPDLARQLFTMLEAARIDAQVLRHYKGIRRDLMRVMAHCLQQRPIWWELPLPHALLEGLLQFTLGGLLAPSAPGDLRLLLQRLIQRAQKVQDATASVYTTAAAVLDCYLFLRQLVLHMQMALAADPAASLAALAASRPDDTETLSLADLMRQASPGGDRMPFWPQGQEAAEGIEPVPYRGDVKPELIQKKLRLQELTEALQHLQTELSPLSSEQLQALLEQGDIDIKSLQEGHLSATSGLFINDLEGRKGQLSQAMAQHDALQREIAALDRDLTETAGIFQTPEPVFLYDEWDYQIQDYRHHWCRLTETMLDEDDTTFVQETRRQYADLMALVRRQFQLLKPEMFKKIKRLMDGEEIDLDSAIEALVDRRAGNALSERVYMRRNKRDRDVAAVFLLDLSASTDDDVPPGPAAPPPPGSTSRQFDFSGFIHDDTYMQAPPRPQGSRRRIIDVEKEALILMAEALEALGDAYAAYGFSGYGRDQVDFFVVKEFGESYDTRVQGRITAMRPHRSTRMGPAIRHATRKLERQEARMKTLLLVSDGYPQDYDYGQDRQSKEYGIQDTMMALREAQLKGIQTFCLTVDPAGHDYLRRMCPDHHYLVIDDITALPNELPKVYQGLTT
jgi:hypothetical protein